MVKICENTIEMVKMTLYNNGDKSRYQDIEMVNINTGKTLKMAVIAPIDFFTVIRAIMYEESLCNFIVAVGDSWSEEVLTDMIEQVVGEE